MCTHAQRWQQKRVGQSHFLLGYRPQLSKSLKVNAHRIGRRREQVCILPRK